MQDVYVNTVIHGESGFYTLHSSREEQSSELIRRKITVYLITQEGVEKTSAMENESSTVERGAERTNRRHKMGLKIQPT